MTATILWLRRDLRLSDHPALQAAAQEGPVIPLFIRDDGVDGLGAAPKWRLGLGLEHFAGRLEEAGSRLTFRSGKALDVLRAVIEETGARRVFWTRSYDPFARKRDTEVKAALKDGGVEARSFGGHLLFEPWSVETKEGSAYKVYSPFWRAVAQRDVATPTGSVGKLDAPEAWPDSERLADWRLEEAMNRGAGVVRPYVQLGEAAAQGRLGAFVQHRIDAYKDDRNIPGEDATSNLSENLALGEISPYQCWHAARRIVDTGSRGAEHFLKELVWREFAYHLLYHTPRITDRNWREEWDAFPWSEDAATSEVTAWQRGRTGVPFVDAAMREMYVTGRMHNRGRMIVASYLTKHLMTHWRIGLDWFEDCLIDWDPASNSMGWQWTAGSGPDAAPYFRIFNPVTQQSKFDPNNDYVDRWIAEGRDTPTDTAMSYFDAIPRSWNLRPDMDYPDPVVGVSDGRKRALSAYEDRKF